MLLHKAVLEETVQLQPFMHPPTVRSVKLSMLFLAVAQLWQRRRLRHMHRKCRLSVSSLTKASCATANEQEAIHKC